jgi:hypothetical protein
MQAARGCWRLATDRGSTAAGGSRVGAALRAIRRHAEASLLHVVGDCYMVEHWLAAYAVLLMS